jgi:hypothetical protein
MTKIVTFVDLWGITEKKKMEMSKEIRFKTPIIVR